MAEIEIDMSAIEAEVGRLSKEELYKQLVDIKTRQRVTQKKYYNPDTAKRARQKRATIVAAMTAKAKELGIYEQIVDEAGAAADEELGVIEANVA